MHPTAWYARPFRNEATYFLNLCLVTFLRILQSHARCCLALTEYTPYPLIHTLHSWSFHSEVPLPSQPGQILATPGGALDPSSQIHCFSPNCSMGVPTSSLYSSHLIYMFSPKLESQLLKLWSFIAYTCLSPVVPSTVVYTQ